MEVLQWVLVGVLIVSQVIQWWYIRAIADIQSKDIQNLSDLTGVMRKHVEGKNSHV